MRRLPFAYALMIVPAMLLRAAPAPKEIPLPPATKEQREASQENLKHIALGTHNYHDAFNALPLNIRDKKDKSLLSWRVQLLPYMDEEALYKQFHLDEAWDSEHNKKLIAKIPKVYQPVRGRFTAGETFYQMFAGEKGLLRLGKPKWTLVNIVDGTSNTFMVAEAGSPVIWTKPDDIAYDGATVPKLGGMFDGEFHVALCDGSVRSIMKNGDPMTLHRAIQPDDGDTVDLQKLETKPGPKE